MIALGNKSAWKLRLAIGVLLLSTGLILLPQDLSAQSEPKYNLGFIPASIAEVGLAFPLVDKWKLSGQVDIQTVFQGAYTNSNPFAYVQRFVLRPWLIYSGFMHMKFYAGYAQNKNMKSRKRAIRKSSSGG